MLYWDGPLLSLEQKIELRRMRLRQELLAVECLSELLPLIKNLPDVGDYGRCLDGGDFNQLEERVLQFVNQYWTEEETKEIHDCLRKYRNLQSIPMQQEFRLCPKYELLQVMQER